MAEADRIIAFARWLKQYDEENYAKWTEPMPAEPSGKELARLAVCCGVNEALGLIRSKFFEVFVDADVNWANVLECDIAFFGDREWHRSHPITEDSAETQS